MFDMNTTPHLLLLLVQQLVQTPLPLHRLLLRLPIHLLQLLLLLRSVRELLVQLTRLLPPPPPVSPRQPRYLIHSPLQVPHLRPSVLQLAQLIRLLLPPLHWLHRPPLAPLLRQQRSAVQPQQQIHSIFEH